MINKNILTIKRESQGNPEEIHATALSKRRQQLPSLFIHSYCEQESLRFCGLMCILCISLFPVFQVSFPFDF